MHLHGNLAEEAVRDADVLLLHRSAGPELQARADCEGLRAGCREAYAREMFRLRLIFHEAQSLEAQDREVEVTVSVDVNGHGRTGVVVEVQALDVPGVEECRPGAVGVMEELVPLVTAPGAAERPLSLDKLLAGNPARLDGLRVGD